MRVTVFGSARLTDVNPAYREAVRLGKLLAERGDIIVSGGYGGIMEAVSRGAGEAGGRVVGVTVAPWIGRIIPNQYLSEEISAKTLYERLEALIESDALIAMDGGAGTLGEIALAWNLRQMDLVPHKPVILVGRHWRTVVKSFEEHLVIAEHDLALLTLVDTVEDAVTALDVAVSGEGEWWG